MKVIIEIDLPDGQAIPKEDDIKRLTSPDWISHWWHIEDVESCDWDGVEVTEDDLREVLKWVDHSVDSSIGISWDTLQCHVDEMIRQKRKAKA